MSTSPYSEDLRKKVINYIEKGNSQRAAAKIFGIHKNTISRWNVRKRKEGTISAKARVGFKSTVDKHKLEEFVKSNPNVKFRDFAQEFGITGSQALSS